MYVDGGPGLGCLWLHLVWGAGRATAVPMPSQELPAVPRHPSSPPQATSLRPFSGVSAGSAPPGRQRQALLSRQASGRARHSLPTTAGWSRVKSPGASGPGLSRLNLTLHFRAV